MRAAVMVVAGLVVTALTGMPTGMSSGVLAGAQETAPGAGASAGIGAVPEVRTSPAHVVSDRTVGGGRQSDDGDVPDVMPGNPTQDLPSSISAKIDDEDAVVSDSLAVGDAGEVRDLDTGTKVTDPRIVGSSDRPADPLAKTDGQSFIPVSAGEVRQAIEARDDGSRSNGGQALARESASSAEAAAITGDSTTMARPVLHRRTHGSARTAALQNNQYGAYWGTHDGSPSFFEADGTLFAQQAKGVIDVSEWQGTIDWSAAKRAGVEGAIIRISYGWGNGFDRTALRNIAECKRLGIPFGVYSYSYAYDASTGAAEGADIVSLLRQAGVNPGDLAYPVYYDLEQWVWAGHAPPTSPSVYDGIVNAWYATLQAAGYGNLSVYSYTSYLNGPLNSPTIRSRTRWVASYGSRTGFDFSTNDRGWQYTSSGSVAGIFGNVDLNAFGHKAYAASIDITRYASVDVPNGIYYISASKRDSAGVDVPDASTANSVRLQLYRANRSAAQRYRFARQSDGSYVIVNEASGKALDVANAVAGPGARVQQYDPNGTSAQRWFLRDAGKGGLYVQSALGNWVLDLSSGGTGDGTKLQLWDPNMSQAQQFLLSSNVTLPTGKPVRISSALDAGKVMDITAASRADGARVQTYAWNGSKAQLYTLNEVGNAIYEIVNVNSGKAVESAGAATGNGAAVKQYTVNRTAAQRWSVRSAGGGRYAFYNEVTNKSIDVPGANAFSGAGLQLYEGNGSKAQQWTVVEVKTARDAMNDLAAQQRSTVPDGTYRVVSALKSSMVLDVAGGSKSDGGNVQLYSDNGTNAQRWRVSHDAAGYVTLTNVGSGKVLDVTAGSKSNGTNVQQYAFNGSWAQKWIAVKDGNRVVLVSGLDSTIVMDVTGAKVSNGTNVQVYAGNNTLAQRWMFVKR